MTTLVAARQPLELLSMSNQQEHRSSKRLAAAVDYEQDDGFKFIRKSKKAKTEAAPEPVVKKSARGRPAKDHAPKATASAVVEEPEPTDNATTETKTTTTARKSSRRKPSVDASHDEPKRVTRRSARLSGDGAAEEPQTNGAPPAKVRRKERAPRPPVVREESPPEPSVESVESAKIALPMSDTPIINRNKEMRKKGNSSRRSSLGSRGRRASSLIDSGQTAIPHREVDPVHFYKHIAEGLPEPRRMKQLLTWCGERALSEKPPLGTPNANAILGARAIQDQILKDFSSRPEFSDWFSRDEDVPKVPVIQKPNPRNIELDEKIVSLEDKIKRLQEQKKAWLAVRKQPAQHQPAPLFSENEGVEIILPDFDLLDPDEGRIRSFLADEKTNFAAIRSRTEERLRQIQSSLEFQVDQLADNIHKVEQRVAVAGKEADSVLKRSAQRLREREEREKKSSGTKDMPIMEVLRSLGSILPEGG
ncbi:Mis12-Mtw1 protein family-domain-containing protein [Stachybotrys elegans]|uniref:Mis12-Mtw1 protein family-domain-containing protein n=1 Tax=Stachybotrys elegans TaxID=80388 RepID=A0A8K0SZA5_9HYPO|nr:Mis12-Mtw1 protein family-domain-containing protein [Stachybotrys elegans]